MHAGRAAVSVYGYREQGHASTACMPYTAHRHAHLRRFNKLPASAPQLVSQRVPRPSERPCWALHRCRRQRRWRTGGHGVCARVRNHRHVEHALRALHRAARQARRDGVRRGIGEAARVRVAVRSSPLLHAAPRALAVDVVRELELRRGAARVRAQCGEARHLAICAALAQPLSLHTPRNSAAPGTSAHHLRSPSACIPPENSSASPMQPIGRRTCGHRHPVRQRLLLCKATPLRRPCMHVTVIYAAARALLHEPARLQLVSQLQTLRLLQHVFEAPRPRPADGLHLHTRTLAPSKAPRGGDDAAV